MEQETLREGAELRAAAQGARSEQLQRGIRDLDPALAEWVDGFVFGEVWQRPGLSFEQRILAAISALAATRNHDQLRAYLFGAVQSGISKDAVQEVLAMQVVYCGFPAGIQALTVWRDVLRSCEKHGLGQGHP